ncbi:MAG TPA: MAPEG family protein [Rhizobiales bacterium]|nr:MAPEG family protein [Hyphomicrobiales bacterium]
MSLTEILMIAVFAQVALTFGVLVKVGTSRVAALKAGEVSLGDVALSAEAWNNNIKKVSNNFNNQFQLPLLLYAGAAFFIMLDKVDFQAIVLAWAFVITRYIHSFIHIRSNRVGRRFKTYATGVFILMAFWLWLALRLYLTG